MMLQRAIRVSVLSTLFALLALPAVLAQSTGEGVALQRGYRTGYSDGYMAGYRDTIDSKNRSYVTHAEYIRADRAYNADYGRITDYRDGYQQGFEPATTRVSNAAASIKIFPLTKGYAAPSLYLTRGMSRSRRSRTTLRKPPAPPNPSSCRITRRPRRPTATPRQLPTVTPP